MASTAGGVSKTDPDAPSLRTQSTCARTLCDPAAWIPALRGIVSAASIHAVASHCDVTATWGLVFESLGCAV